MTMDPTGMRGFRGVGACVASLRFFVSGDGIQITARYQDERGVWQDGVAEVTRDRAIEILRMARVENTVLGVEG